MNADFTQGDDSPKKFAARVSVLIEPLGVSPKKALEYLIMFLVLGALVYLNLTNNHDENQCGDDRTYSIPEVAAVFVKFFIYTAWPFGLVAACDASWTDKDAGNVFLVAYLVATMVWFHHTSCAFCIFSFLFGTFPFLLTGMIAHRIGMWTHLWRKTR